MFDWFEKLVRQAIWKALNAFFTDLAALAEARIIEKPQSLTAVQQLSTPPLIRVTAVHLAADTFRILVRGALSFAGITPFMRLEVPVARSDVNVAFASAPLTSPIVVPAIAP